jgi:hypothetical protein
MNKSKIDTLIMGSNKPLQQFYKKRSNDKDEM